MASSHRAGRVAALLSLLQDCGDAILARQDDADYFDILLALAGYRPIESDRDVRILPHQRAWTHVSRARLVFVLDRTAHQVRLSHRSASWLRRRRLLRFVTDLATSTGGTLARPDGYPRFCALTLPVEHIHALLSWSVREYGAGGD